MARARDGNPAPVAALDQEFEAILADAPSVIECTDVGDQTLGQQEARALIDDWGTSYPLFGETSATYTATYCQGWPREGTIDATDQPVGLEPMLLLSSSGDPYTTPDMAAEMAAQFPDSVLVTLDSPERGAYWASGCVGDLVEDYLLTGTLPEPTTCTD